MLRSDATGRSRVSLAVTAFVLPMVLAACGDAASSSADQPVTAAGSETVGGTGFLTVLDLPDPPAPGHFTGEPVETTAQLVARQNGCVNVIIDGVERVPLWPGGSEVAPAPETSDGYVVTLPSGPVLSAAGDSGDTFTALGLVDQGSGPFTAEPDPPGKVDTFLAFCAVEAGPVSFPDASTFVVPDDDNS